MGVASTITNVVERSRGYRARFGQIAGAFAWWQTRQNYKRPPGTRFPVRVPGCKVPVWLRAGTSDIQCFEQIMLRGELDFSLPHEPKWIIDAGANIGLATLAFVQRFPRARIVALEVDAANFDLLRHNVASYPNVEVRRTALWACDGYVRISNPTAHSYAFRVESCPEHAPDALPAVSPATLMAQLGVAGIDLFKIDIEGSEFDVLHSPESWISRCGTVAIELHDRFRPGCSEALVSALAGTPHGRRKCGEYDVVDLGASAVI